MSIRPQLIDTLILHGAVRALEARVFSIKPGADGATSIGHSATKAAHPDRGRSD